MVVKISENQDMKSLLPAPRSHTSFSRCKGVEFKQGCRAKEDVDAVVVRIAQIAEIAYYTCRWIAPVNIEPIIPLDHHLADDLVLLQHGFYTYSLLWTTNLTIPVSNQWDSATTCFLRDDIYFFIAIRQYINSWNLLLKGGMMPRT
jgi:hypothetical protein